MPTIKQLSLPDGNTYDLTAVNREVVPVITEYSGSETTFNALEITENEDQQTIYNINAPNGTALFTWTDDSTLDYPLTVSKGIKITGKFSPRGGTYFSDSTALPKQAAAASYAVMCIDDFKSGGQAKWCTATSSATANTIVARQANGYIYSTYYNSSNGAENIASYTSYVGFVDSNGWHRKTSLANFKNWFGQANSAATAAKIGSGALYVKQFTQSSGKVAANTLKSMTFNCAVSGYTVIGCVGFNTGNGSFYVCTIQSNPSNSTVSVSIKNKETSSVQTASMNIWVLYRQN